MHSDFRTIEGLGGRNTSSVRGERNTSKPFLIEVAIPD
jgi:hypothetical protein